MTSLRVLSVAGTIVSRNLNEGAEGKMRELTRIFIVCLLASAACTGCFQVIKKPDDLSKTYDQTNSFTVMQPFDVVYGAVEAGAKRCWDMTTNGVLMPTGSGYVYAGGIRREVEARILEPGKSASVAVVIHAPPVFPVNYILLADISALETSEIRVTTFNSDGNKGQRAFHQQVRAWVNGNANDCTGM